MPRRNTSPLALLAAMAMIGVGCPQWLDDDFGTVSSTSDGSAPAPVGAGGTNDGPPSDAGGTGSGNDTPDGSSGSEPLGSAGNSGSMGGSGAAGASGSAGNSGGSTASCAAPSQTGPGGRCYLSLTASANFAGARSQCRARGAGWDLMSIGSAEESAFLATFLQTEAWVGADDGGTLETWRWVDDGTEFWEGRELGRVIGSAFVNWSSNEPDGGGHDCLRVLPSGALWADLDCGEGRPSVCEGPPQ